MNESNELKIDFVYRRWFFLDRSLSKLMGNQTLIFPKYGYSVQYLARQMRHQSTFFFFDIQKPFHF